MDSPPIPSSVGRPLETDTCRDYVEPALAAAGWGADHIVEQYPVADGAVLAPPAEGGGTVRRERPLRADYVLLQAPGHPVAVVEAKREHRKPDDGLAQAKRYAERLDVCLAYATNGRGIVEFDFHHGTEAEIAAFPGPAEVVARHRAWKGVADDDLAHRLTVPFLRGAPGLDGRFRELRYYQRVAVQRVLEAILVSGRRRLLLVMATGTGKTFTALQIIGRLREAGWTEGRSPRVLYLADRRQLIDQPILREFAPVFGEVVHRIRGQATFGREIYFSLYQSIADGPEREGVFRDYPPDFFDLVIVDECHRGSASADSAWRAVLEYFSPAVQLGLTATPVRAGGADSYRYFGEPVYEYSLRQGIEDGFLAPYRVRRVRLSSDVHGWSPEPGERDRFGREIPDGVYGPAQFERVVSLLVRTRAAARHLADYMARTDRMAKTIVFCVDSEHAAQMRRELTNLNSDLVQRHPDYVVRIVADEGEIGAGHLADLANPESPVPVIATTSKLLSTGVDVPTVRNIVLFKPIGSMVEFKQIIGRGTRLYPDEDKLVFDIVDYSDATALFEDPAFDGPPQHVREVEVDDSGAVVEADDVQEPEPGYGDETPVPPDDAQPRDGRKYYVDDGEVWVVGEGVWVPSADDGRLRLVEYRDYVATSVRRVFGTAASLRDQWRTREGRAAIREAMRARGVDLDEAAERLGMTDADALDVLVHVAWSTPLVPRRERIRRLRAEDATWLRSYGADAREILEMLLEKYAAHGIGQLDDLRVVESPPLSRVGTSVEIAARFGTPKEFREAVAGLARRLYAA